MKTALVHWMLIPVITLMYDFTVLAKHCTSYMYLFDYIHFASS